MKEIPLTRGQVAIVDNADYTYLSQFKWFAWKDRKNGMYYAMRSPSILMHRVIMGLTDPKIQVDHKNGNGLDNQRENLRTATGRQNQYNQGIHRNNTSGFKGVYWQKSARKWRAFIKVRGKQVHLGLFDDPQKAAQAYDIAAIHHAGEYAKLNFERGEI